MNEADKKMAPPLIFSHKVLAQNQLRAKNAPSSHDFLFEEIHARLLERVGEVTKNFTHPLNLGYPQKKILFNHQSAENLNLPAQSHDLITSVLQLHWTNDLLGALIQFRNALKPDGALIACMFGGDTLIELKSALLQAELEITERATMRISPLADVRDLGGLLQRAGYSLPLVDVDRIEVQYSGLIKLMHDLRYMGEGNALASRPKTLRRDIIARASDIYAQKFAHKDGGLRATFDVIFLTAWAPHESQPQPLKPGSAKMNLAQVLDKNKKI